MADVAPFRGLRYNRDKVPGLSEVVIPPYDVISPAEQEAFHQMNPHSMIRLELGMATPSDSAEDNPHTRAAGYLRQWTRENVLLREDKPALYYYELDYSIGSLQPQTRYGFICAFRLEDFKSGSVKPHEKTFQAVKDERLGLMLSCHANLSSVFALYSDPQQEIDCALKTGREREPIMQFKDRREMEHRIWRVTDLEVLRHVRDLMSDKAIFIADGHHRYETALNYRRLMRERFKDASPRASFEYIMMYLSNLNEDGLTILPTHRMLKNLGSRDPESFVAGAAEFFQVSSFREDDEGVRKWRSELEKCSMRKETAIGFYCRGLRSFYLLKARWEPISAFLGCRGVPGVLQHLDVVVLDQVVLRKLLGLSEEFLASEHNIHFNHDLDEAVSRVRGEDYDAAFLINSTRIEQVQEVASAGLIMPHKSTYFYPKVGSGMVIRTLSPDEEVIW